MWESVHLEQEHVVGVGGTGGTPVVDGTDCGGSKTIHDGFGSATLIVRHRWVNHPMGDMTSTGLRFHVNRICSAKVWPAWNPYISNLQAVCSLPGLKRQGRTARW